MATKALGLAVGAAAIAWSAWALAFGSEPGHVYPWITEHFKPALPVLALWAVWELVRVRTGGDILGRRTNRSIGAVPLAMAVLYLCTIAGLTFHVRFVVSRPALDRFANELEQTGTFVRGQPVGEWVGLFWVVASTNWVEGGGVETTHTWGTKLVRIPNRATDRPLRLAEHTCRHVRDDWWQCRWSAWGDSRFW